MYTYQEIVNQFDIIENVYTDGKRVKVKGTQWGQSFLVNYDFKHTLVAQAVSDKIKNFIGV